MRTDDRDAVTRFIYYLVEQDKKRRERTEKIVFISLVCLGGIFTGAAWAVTDLLAQSLFLNIGSNIIVFVFLFAIFQLFVGRQPGNMENEQLLTLKGVLDYGETNDNADQQRNLSRQGPSRNLGPGFTDNDQAKV